MSCELCAVCYVLCAVCGERRAASGEVFRDDHLERADDAPGGAPGHQPRLDDVDRRHDHGCGHAGERTQHEVLLRGRRLSGQLLECCLRLREEHERERIPRHVTGDCRCVSLVEAGDAVCGKDLLEADDRVGVNVRLDALLEHLLRHADDRRCNCAQRTAQDLRACAGDASDLALRLAPLVRGELQGSRRECKHKLRADAFEEGAGRPLDSDAFGLQPRAHHVDWVKKGLGCAAGCGPRDEAFAEEHLLLPA